MKLSLHGVPPRADRFNPVFSSFQPQDEFVLTKAQWFESVRLRRNPLDGNNKQLFTDPKTFAYFRIGF